MANWHALSKEKHENSGWVAPTGYPQAKQDAMTPLLVAELSHAIAYFPIVFAPVAEGRYQLNALLSVESGTNLFLTAQNKWMVPYVPASYRSTPFNMLPNENGEFVLAVDMDSEFFHLEAQADDRAVLVDGQPAEDMASLIEFMRHRVAQQKQTNELVQQLSEANLIEAWPIEFKVGPAEEDVRRVNGLFRINEPALMALPEQTLAELMKSGALAMAYAQLLSQARLQDLQKRYAIFKQQMTPESTEAVDLDKLFDGDSEGDVFSF